MNHLPADVEAAVRAFPGKSRAERNALMDDLHVYEADAVLSAMQTLMHSDDEAFLAYLMEAVVRFDKSRAAPVLLPFLESPSDNLRYHACGLLGDCANPQATSALLERAQSDSDVDVRSLAIFSLGKIGDASIIPALEAIARADDAVNSHGFAIPDSVNTAINYIHTGTTYPRST